MPHDSSRDDNHSKQPSQACAHASSSTDPDKMARVLTRIKHKVLVLSGKGGVGKSTVATNLAMGLAMAGKAVGILDVDIHGPSVPKLLGVDKAHSPSEGNVLRPIPVTTPVGRLTVMSIGFFLTARDEAVIWRGPRKHGLIRQFLTDVEWGDLDYLIIDAPPGTGDEPLAVVELLGNADGAVIVTTPQEIAVQDVRRCVGFCRELRLPVIGVVENMSGFCCPKCGEVFPIFGKGGGEQMAREMGVPFLGEIPLESGVVTSGDDGAPTVLSRPESLAGKGFKSIVGQILAQ
jgi:ATP-binding protein involved in chromosome partitioning